METKSNNNSNMTEYNTCTHRSNDVISDINKSAVMSNKDASVDALSDYKDILEIQNENKKRS